MENFLLVQVWKQLSLCSSCDCTYCGTSSIIHPQIWCKLLAEFLSVGHWKKRKRCFRNTLQYIHPSIHKFVMELVCRVFLVSALLHFRRMLGRRNRHDFFFFWILKAIMQTHCCKGPWCQCLKQAYSRLSEFEGEGVFTCCLYQNTAHHCIYQIA
jgi:hypothetical protein